MPIDALNNLKGSSVTVNTDIQPRPKSVKNSTAGAAPVSGSVSGSISGPETGLSPEQVVQPSPAAASIPPQKGSESSPEQLLQAVERVQEQVQSVRRDLQFKLDEESGKTVIKVLDSQTGETIRQIPSEEMLQISRALSEAMEELSEDPSEQLPSVLLDEKV